MNSEEAGLHTLNVESSVRETERIVTPATWKRLEKLGIFTHWLRFHPFIWDTTLNAPVVARKLSFCRWQLLLGMVFYVLVLIRMIQVIILRPGSSLEQMFLFFMTCWFFMFVLLQVHAYSRREQTVCWLQGIFLLTQKCEESYLKGSSANHSTSAKCGTILRILIVAFRADLCCMVAVSLARPLLPQLSIPQIMPEEILQLDSYGIANILLFLLEISVAASYNEIAIFYGCWFVMSTLTINDIVDAMRSLIHPRLGRGGEEENQRFVRLFRSLNLLTEDFSKVFVMIVGSGHLGLVLICIFCAYGAIRFDGALSISLGWIGANVTIFLATLIVLFGGINHSSQLALKAIRKRQAKLHCMGKQVESRWLQREILCLRGLRLRVGPAFFYDKILLLTTLEILIQNIASLLLLD